jgi:hypothetical protein
MSILYKLGGVPVFSEIKNARSWGQKYNLLGFHTHERDGRIGYMAGATHADTVKIVKGSAAPGIHEQSSLDNWVGNESVNTGAASINQNVTPPVSPTIVIPSNGGGGY